MGFEPTTSAVTGRRSNQLSHRAIRRYYTFKTAYSQILNPSFLNLSGVGVGYLRGAVLSTRGPGWTDLWCIGCSTKSMAE